MSTRKPYQGPKAPKGLAALSPERRQEIARLGGKASQQGKGHRFNSDSGRRAQTLGGNGRPKIPQNPKDEPKIPQNPKDEPKIPQNPKDEPKISPDEPKTSQLTEAELKALKEEFGE